MGILGADDQILFNHQSGLVLYFNRSVSDVLERVVLNRDLFLRITTTGRQEYPVVPECKPVSNDVDGIFRGCTAVDQLMCPGNIGYRDTIQGAAFYMNIAAAIDHIQDPSLCGLQGKMFKINVVGITQLNSVVFGRQIKILSDMH